MTRDSSKRTSEKNQISTPLHCCILMFLRARCIIGDTPCRKQESRNHSKENLAAELLFTLPAVNNDGTTEDSAVQATNTCKSSKITPSIDFFTTRRLPSMKRTVGTPASLGRSGAVRKPAVSTAPEPVRMMSMKYQPQLRGSLATEFSLFHSGQRLF